MDQTRKKFLKIVAFGHRRRTGKNTCADYLFMAIKTRRPDLRVFLGGFADAVKEQAYKLFSWAGLQKGIHYDNHPEEKEVALPALGLSPRDVWIHIGESLRVICPNVWVELLMQSIPPETDIAIIYDLRKLPEASRVETSGGSTYRVLRDVPQFPDPVDSELVDYDRWAGEISNDGSKADLMKKMELLAEEVIGKLTTVK